MIPVFSPTPQDVERYRHLRALGTELTQDIVNTIPALLWEEMGEAIDILHTGMIDEHVHVRNVLADCCIYESFENGKNIIQRFAEAHPEQPGTDEHYVLDAYLRAEYRIVRPQSAVPGVGIHCRDLRNREELFLMDLSFSRTRDFGAMSLAGRLVPLGGYWITTGAALPLFRTSEIEIKLREIDELGLWSPVRYVRSILSAGGAEWIRHDDTGIEPRRRGRPVVRTPDPTDLCSCRSGLMYKYCCGRVKAAPKA